jgi:hypothetical protein
MGVRRCAAYAKNGGTAEANAAVSLFAHRHDVERHA